VSKFLKRGSMSRGSRDAHQPTTTAAPDAERASELRVDELRCAA
jgi:hypothetical protein